MSTSTAPSLAKQNTAAGSYTLVSIDGAAPSAAPLCGGSVIVSRGALTLAPNGTFDLALGLANGQWYQESGTYKQQGSTLTFKRSSTTVTGVLQNGTIVISQYTYCGETHSLTFASATAPAL